MKIKLGIKKYIKKYFLNNYLKDVNNKKYKKSALMVYVIEAFRIKKDSKNFRFHLNRWRNIAIAELFTKLGYSVDVINYDDIRTASKITKEYDVLFGLGPAYEYLVKRKAGLFKTKIYFATDAPTNYQNKKEINRINEVNKKYDIILMPKRLSKENDQILKKNDVLIVLGNDFALERYKRIFNGRIYSIAGHIADDIDFYTIDKEWDKAKYNFLFLTGRGKIRCCLDLLLEIFSENPDWNLYICGHFKGEEDFELNFRKYLKNTINIHTKGWVDTASIEFSGLIKKCGAMIMPVISGASNGSALLGMSHGLIPIISQDATIDIDNNGVIIKEITKKSINKSIEQFLSYNKDWYEKTSLDVYRMTRRIHSQEAFIKRLIFIFNDYGL
jgi:hypothetical protein